jgi:hypothetical protein
MAQNYLTLRALEQQKIIEGITFVIIVLSVALSKSLSSFEFNFNRAIIAAVIDIPNKSEE